jgi:hypothetical protein
MAAEHRGREVTGPIRSDGEARLSRAVAEAGEIQHEHRHDERAETIDERSTEQNPGRRGKGAELLF